MNPAMEGILPQFERGVKVQNVYSFAEVEQRVLKYLAGALNGAITGNGELLVNGKQQAVLSRVRQLQPLIEAFFDNMPKVAAAIRKNKTFYLPYANCSQIEETKTAAGKAKVLQGVMDNFQYNTELGSLNGVKKEPPETFARKKRQWEQKVGYFRRLKKI